MNIISHECKMFYDENGICKIKKLSDNTFFELNEEVYVKTNRKYWHPNKWIIEKFNLDTYYDVLQVVFKINKNSSTTTWFGIKDIQKKYTLQSFL